MASCCAEMDRSFFTNLPSEITIDILSRLPIKSVISCKCVNKPWLQLLQTPEFVKSHLSKSAPGIINFHGKMYSEFIVTFELVDEPELDCHELHYNPVSKFDIKEFISPAHSYTSIGILGSADGLFFLRKREVLYLCNPITREYIVIPGIGGTFQWPSFAVYGFGKIMKSGEYKIIRLFLEHTCEPGRNSINKHSKSECQVYTIGTRSWRSIAPDNSHEYDSRVPDGTFHYGNLHWLVSDLISGVMLISYFDLEKEQFGVISLPPDLPERGAFFGCGSLTVLENLLCLCDNTSDYEINIWIMKEYGVEKSWAKELVIRKVNSVAGHIQVVYALKVFKDGDILLSWDDFNLFYYSNRTKSFGKVDHVEMRNAGSIQTKLHVPSFVSLKSFMMENVKYF